MLSALAPVFLFGRAFVDFVLVQLFIIWTLILLKDVRANCFCASLLRTQIQMRRHASSARAKY